MVLACSLVDMTYHVDCFMSLHPGDKSHLVMVNILLNVLLDPIGQDLVPIGQDLVRVFGIGATDKIPRWCESFCP